MTVDIPKIAGTISLLISYVRGAIDIDENAPHVTVLIKVQNELSEMARTILPDYEDHNASQEY
jgi:hypothetical protein